MSLLWFILLPISIFLVICGFKVYKSWKDFDENGH